MRAFWESMVTDRFVRRVKVAGIVFGPPAALVGTLWIDGETPHVLAEGAGPLIVLWLLVVAILAYNYGYGPYDAAQ
jgi:hypothetical protein